MLIFSAAAGYPGAPFPPNESARETEDNSGNSYDAPSGVEYAQIPAATGGKCIDQLFCEFLPNLWQTRNEEARVLANQSLLPRH